jgi:hypothetical protein
MPERPQASFVHPIALCTTCQDVDRGRGSAIQTHGRVAASQPRARLRCCQPKTLGCQPKTPAVRSAVRPDALSDFPDARLISRAPCLMSCSPRPPSAEAPGATADLPRQVTRRRRHVGGQTSKEPRPRCSRHDPGSPRDGRAPWLLRRAVQRARRADPGPPSAEPHRIVSGGCRVADRGLGTLGGGVVADPAWPDPAIARTAARGCLVRLHPAPLSPRPQRRAGARTGVRDHGPDRPADGRRAAAAQSAAVAERRRGVLAAGRQHDALPIWCSRCRSPAGLPSPSARCC